MTDSTDDVDWYDGPDDGPDDGVELFVRAVLARTQKAALCRIDGHQVWLPLSQCTDGSGLKWDPFDGEFDVTICIPRWLAEKNGL